MSNSNTANVKDFELSIEGSDAAVKLFKTHFPMYQIRKNQDGAWVSHPDYGKSIFIDEARAKLKRELAALSALKNLSFNDSVPTFGARSIEDGRTFTDLGPLVIQLPEFKVVANGSVIGPDGEPVESLPQLSMSERIIRACLQNPKIQRAFDLLSSDSSFADHYMAFEDVESAAGNRQSISRKGWATRAGVIDYADRMNSRNNRARHGGDAHRSDTAGSITLEESRKFVLGLVQEWALSEVGPELPAVELP